MPKAPEREMRVLVNKAARRIEVVMLSDGSPVGECNFTQEQAEHHARVLIDAIEMLNAGKPGLILPDKLN